MDRIIDRFLLLCAFRELEGRGGGHLTVVQKTVFAAEVMHRKHKLRGYNYAFFRHHYGPFSKEVWDDWDILKKLGLAQSQRGAPTSRGRQIVEAILPTARRNNANRTILAHIGRSASRFGGKSREEAARIAYKMQVEPDGLPGKKWTIRQIPQYADILRRLRENVFQHRFTVSDEAFHWLTFELDPETAEAVRTPSRKSVRKVFVGV